MLNISQFQTIIPTRLLNSLSIMFHGQNANVESIKFPISTFETTLFHSIQRGCNITKAINGIKTNIIKYNMTRSLILQCKDSFFALELINKLKFDKNEIQNIISQSSKFTEFIGFTERIIGNLLYLRLEFTTGDASGHNMSTKASDIIIDYILFKYNNDDLKYISISGNYCTDKKNSSVNAILGRGYSVIAEGIINRDLCLKLLKTTPEKIVNLNIKKNLIGSIIAGSIQSANAHFANMMSAFYLATGQDIANIVEGSQGITFAEINSNGDLYFSISCPNIIMGTFGNGKNLDFVKHNLEQMQCVGDNATKRLVQIMCGIIWCGELSLLSAITNKNELIRGHLLYER